MEANFKKLLVLAVALATFIGCSSEQDIGDAAKAPPAGTMAPGAPASGGTQTAQPAGTPNPGQMQSPR